MKALTKSKVMIVFSRKVELIRVMKFGWISVSGTQTEKNFFTSKNGLPTQLNIFDGYSNGELNGTIESKEFFYRTVDE